jgi:signal-transduction protein with cAMP-binding, CBS, and nucleotidyltransferase domain
MNQCWRGAIGAEFVCLSKEGTMEISKAMHSKASWVSFDTPVSEVAKLMKKDDVGAIPVGKDDRLIGMITDRDLALRIVAEGRDPTTTSAEEVMTPDIVYCQTHQTVEDAIHLMDQKKIRRLPVLNEKKRMVGMLSLGDVSHAVSRDLSGELLRAVTDHHS